MKPGLTVKASTVFAIGCLIDNFHSLGNEPISLMLESIKVIIKTRTYKLLGMIPYYFWPNLMISKTS